MRKLKITVLTADAERLRGALTLASAQAALGGGASLFLLLDAVALLRSPLSAPRDAAHGEAGLPTLDMLLNESLQLGVTITACQSGMALAGMTEQDLPRGVEAGGPIIFLQGADDEDRLLVI